MPRSRSSSRPASRPSSRPPSMMSTALNLSPQVQHLGDLLIAKITGFSRDEENFGICHDFLVSNLLYHTYLEPHDRDVKKRCEKLTEKWDIQNKGQKAARFEELLSRYYESPIFNQTVDHEQHGLKARLLVLLLSLTNSDQVQVDVDENAIDEGVEMLLKEIVQESESSKAARKAAEVRAMLAEGEDTPPQYSDFSDLSDWSDEEEEDNYKPPIIKPEKKVSVKHVKKPITHLPGVSKPLEPPKPIDEFEDCQAQMSEAQARNWMEDNLIPPYWKSEIDSKSSFTLEVTNPMPDAHYVQAIDTYLYESGQPVEEKLILPEYQVLYECIWLMRNPLCQKSPLFEWTGSEFKISQSVGLPSLMPLTLASSLEKLRISLNSSQRLHFFISDTLDRRKDPGDIEDSHKPPFTYEAYAEALTNVMNLLSADLLETERKIKARTETYTLLDFFRETSSWQKLINSLGTFHYSAVTKHKDKENWEKAVLLLSALDQAVNTCHEEKLFSIFVDLHLKTMAPYFRIIGVWLTQGRFEDYRSEFVYGVHDSIVSARVNSELDLTGCSSFVSYLSTPSEKFWTHGFIVRPFQELATAEGLRSPQIFEHAFPKILTCGKSITILSFLEKQSVLYPGYKSTFTPIQDMINPHELYDNFLANLRQSLSIHRISKLPKMKRNIPASIPMITEGLSLCDIIGNVDQYDPDLVAAYDIISADLPIMNDEDNLPEIIDLQEDNLIDPDRFLVLSGFGLDPVKPMTSTIKEAFVPVVHIHTDRACQRLVHLFRHTLDLEQSLVYLRRVFFMEAGDLMSEFYNHMFQMIGHDRKQYEQWDATSLNILLHDCLSRRFLTEEIEKFSIDIDLNAKNPLETLVLSYNVKWPLNIVLHSESLEMYNKIFNFLLKVKHALWALLKIDCKELASTISESGLETTDSFSVDDSSRTDSDESMEDKETKLHRVILLRSWLLHFISNIHDYFMTRVLQSTQMELHASLMECDDLDAILDVHNRYIHRIYDRCFLHPSASLLKECVFKVLKSAMVLYKHCETHVQNPKGDCFIIANFALKTLEENYARRHQFLATTLRSMTQKRNIPHLDGLSAALLHSCPEVQ